MQQLASLTVPQAVHEFESLRASHRLRDKLKVVGHEADVEWGHLGWNRSKMHSEQVREGIAFLTKNGPIPAYFSLFSSFQYTIFLTVNDKYNFLPMTIFKLRTSAVRSDPSTN